MIDSVNEYNKAHGTATDYQIDNIADCQSALLDYIKMQDMSGYAGMEAAHTIQGSLAMVKGAWENLVVGMANPDANLSELINNLVSSVKTAAEQLLPVIKDTLKGIGTLIEELSPVIAEALPVLVESLLPTLITSGMALITALINGVITALPALGTALMEAVQILLTQVFGVSEENASKFAEGVTGAFTKVKDGFFEMVESAQTDGTWLNEIWTGLQDTGKAFCDFCVALWDALSSAFAWCVEQINTEGTYLNTIWENIQTFISAAISIIQGVIKTFTAVLRGDWSAAWESVKDTAQTVSDAVSSIVGNILDYLVGLISDMAQAASDLIRSLKNALEANIKEIKNDAGGWVTDNIITPISNMASGLYNAGVNLINSFWDGMKSIWDSIASWWDGLSFSEKTVPKPSMSGGRGGGFATGLNFVPYDEFPAILHRGEAVLTAAEARVWRKNGLGGAAPAMAGGGIVINQYIQTVPQTPVDFANATEAYFEQARWTL